MENCLGTLFFLLGEAVDSQQGCIGGVSWMVRLSFVGR